MIRHFYRDGKMEFGTSSNGGIADFWDGELLRQLQAKTIKSHHSRRGVLESDENYFATDFGIASLTA